MININFIRTKPELVKEGIQKKFVNPEIVDNFLKIDTEWKLLKKEINDMRASQKLMGDKERDKAKELKDKIAISEGKMNVLDAERNLLLLEVPNLPEDSVPVGKDENDNLVLKVFGEPANFDFIVKDYVELSRGEIDTLRAAKISGSRFGYINNEIAELDFALFRFGIDTLLPYGFALTIPPVLIKPEVLRRMGKGRFVDSGEAFYVQSDDLCLVGSSEQSIAPMFMDEIVSVNTPMRFLGFSTCFRREAGSYGKDTKGILRTHQFNKLEMFIICAPEISQLEHEFLLARQEELMQKLGLPYRVVVNATGDMGFDASKQYDVEVWMPSQNKYRETHSCSNTTDFQSNGLNITYKTIGDDGKEKREFVHTLNATAFSERPILAILENFQKADGSVEVPEVLRKYMGKDKILLPK